MSFAHSVLNAPTKTIDAANFYRQKDGGPIKPPPAGTEFPCPDPRNPYCPELAKVPVPGSNQESAMIQVVQGMDQMTTIMIFAIMLVMIMVVAISQANK